MPNSSAWSKPSRACRIDLRASRMLAASLVALGLAGTAGWFLSDAGMLLAIFGSGAGLAWSVRLAAAEATRSTLLIVLGADGVATIDGRPVDDFAIDWRGTLASLSWREQGRVHRRLAFPDALHAAARRELRLWALARREHPLPAAVAP